MVQMGATKVNVSRSIELFGGKRLVQHVFITYSNKVFSAGENESIVL